MSLQLLLGITKHFGRFLVTSLWYKSLSGIGKHRLHTRDVSFSTLKKKEAKYFTPSGFTCHEIILCVINCHIKKPCGTIPILSCFFCSPTVWINWNHSETEYDIHFLFFFCKNEFLFFYIHKFEDARVLGISNIYL